MMIKMVGAAALLSLLNMPSAVMAVHLQHEEEDNAALAQLEDWPNHSLAELDAELGTNADSGAELGDEASENEAEK